MPAYFGPWRVISTQSVSPQQLALARKLVGSMLEVGGVPSRRWDLPDGSVISALIVNGMPKVTITPAGVAVSPEATRADLWAPRGFLVVPAGASTLRGAGLPVVQQGSDPYAAENLDPGLDITRWTPGGPHGQVLLTLDDDAGYPDPSAIAAPMHYSPLGPNPYLAATFDQRKTGSTWLAFRPSYMDFLPHDASDNIGARRAVFDAVNGFRSGHGIDVAYLMPRGFYRPAEVLSTLVTADGIAQLAYPSGYQSTDERLLKDGPWSQATSPPTPSYQELVATGMSTAGGVDGWESNQATALLLDPTSKAPVFADVGCNAGNLALTLQVREHWIMAGRRVFQSADAALPPISWDGPPSLNLGWMTLPIAYANESILIPTAPLVSNGQWWCSYYTSTHESRPAIGPNIYCRGRVLGVLPNVGQVLGAGIVVINNADPTKNVDRLMVIGYHPSENTALDVNTQGLMAVAHVWYADFPHGDALRLHTEHVVADVQVPQGSANPPPMPWIDGGTQLLPGIKYESFWEFAPDGLHALCLRDGADLGTIGYALQNPLVSSTFIPARVANVWSGAFAGVLCELAFGTAPPFALQVTNLATPAYAPLGNSSINNFRPTLYPSNPAGVPFDCWASENPLQALAAGYNKNGQPRVAYYGSALLMLNRTDPRLPSPNPATIPDNFAYSGAGRGYIVFGDTSLKFPSDANDFVIVGDGAFGYDEGFADPAAPPMIVDIVTSAAVADVRTAPKYITAFTPDATWPDFYYTIATADNADYQSDVMNTFKASRRVRIYQRGIMLNESSYAHSYGIPWSMFGFRLVRAPDGTYYSPSYYGSGGYPPPADTSPVDPSYVLTYDSPKAIYSTASTHVFPAVPAQTLQPFYATRFDEEMIGYQVGLASPITDLWFKGMTNPVLQDRAAAFAGNITQTISADQRPVIGGWYRASFPVPDIGGNWLAEARVA